MTSNDADRPAPRPRTPEEWAELDALRARIRGPLREKVAEIQRQRRERDERYWKIINRGLPRDLRFTPRRLSTSPRRAPDA